MPRNVRPILVGSTVYLAAIAVVVLGGAFGLRAALGTVPQPSFLMPEYFKATPKSHEPTLDAVVQVKRYSPPNVASQATWKPSLVRGFSTQAELASQNAAPVHAKRLKKEKRVRRRAKAMDAYASGGVGGF